MDTTLDSVRDVAPVQSFSRKSSGLVRELTLADAAWYGVLGSGGLFAFVFLFPGPQFASPGVSVPLMLVATLLFGVIVYFVYAGLGSAMPRAGGDYLYETRSLTAVVGFTVPWACQAAVLAGVPDRRRVRRRHLRPRPDRDRGRARRRRLVARHGVGDVRRRGGGRARLLAAQRGRAARLPHRPALGAHPAHAHRDGDDHRPAPRQPRHRLRPEVQRVPRRRDHDQQRGGRGGEGRLSAVLVQPRQHADMGRGARRLHPVHDVLGARPAGRGQAGLEPPPAVHGVLPAGSLRRARRPRAAVDAHESRSRGRASSTSTRGPTGRAGSRRPTRRTSASSCRC